MKKFSLIALSALACWGMSSCDEFEMPNPPAQSNPEEVVFNADDLSVLGAVDARIDIPQHIADQTPVELFNYTVTDFPESYTLTLGLQMSPTADFATYQEMPMTLTDSTATMRAAELQELFNAAISKNIEAAEAYVRVPAYAVNGNSVVRLGGPDTYYYTGILDIQPAAHSYTIESDYYLVGSFCNWDISKGIRFEQVNSGNPYDNPDFELTFDVTDAQAAAGYDFKIVPLSGFENNSWDGAYGMTDITESATGMSGKLAQVPGAETDAATIAHGNHYRISINMETLAFSVKLESEFLYVPSATSSLTDFSKMMRLTTSNYVNYEGSLALNGDFFFTAQESTTGGFVFRNAGDTEVAGGDYTTVSGTLTEGNGVAAEWPEEGLYFVKVDLSSLAYSAVLFKEIDLIGAFNGWDASTALPLTASDDFSVWTIDNVEMTAGEYKFCISKAWTYSYGKGASDNEVAQNGGNFNLDADGTYDFKLDFSSYPATLTVTKK